MRIAIVTALSNQAGLQRDYQLLAQFLAARGHEVTGVAWRSSCPARTFDLAIFLEVFHERFLGIAERAWMVPNPEWWEWTPFLEHFELVLCKTRDCQRLFEPLVGSRAVFTGFLSKDMNDPDVPRERVFLHAAGASTTKGTAAVLEAWKQIGERAPLVVAGGVHLRREALRGGLRDVTFCNYLREESYCRLQNMAIFRLCVSEYEGWGHCLHEALSVGATIAATRAPPMSETDGIARYVDPVRQSSQRLATMSFVDADGVRAAVEQMAAMSDDAIAVVRDRARAAFHEAQSGFALRFTALLAIGTLSLLLSGCSLLTFDDDLRFDRHAALPDAAAPPDAVLPDDAAESGVRADAGTEAADAAVDVGPLFVSRDTARSPLPQCTFTARPAESMVELVRLISADGPPCPGPSPRFPEGTTSAWAVEPDCRFVHVRTFEAEGWSLRIEDTGVYTAPGRAEGAMTQVSNGCEHRWDVRWVDEPCADPPPESPWLRCRQDL